MTKVFLTFLFIGAYTLTSQELVYQDKILAKVNGKVITSYDLEESTLRMQQQIREFYSAEIAEKRITELKSSSLQQLIDDIIVLDEFKAKKAQFPDSLVDNKLEREIKIKSNGNRTKFIEMLDRAGISMEEYREKIHDTIAIQLMVSENVRRKVNVTPVDISHYYDKNSSKFLKDEEIRGAVIAVMKDTDSSTPIELRLKAITEVLKKEDFGKVADKLSEMPGKKEGGDLGYRKPDELNKVFITALTGLEENEISAPVESDGSYFIFKLLDKRGGNIRPLNEVRDFIKNLLEDKQERKYYDDYIASIRKKASIEVFSEK